MEIELWHSHPFTKSHFQFLIAVESAISSAVKKKMIVHRRKVKTVGRMDCPSERQLQQLCRKCVVCLHWRTHWSHFATKSTYLPALRKRRRVAHALEFIVVAQAMQYIECVLLLSYSGNTHAIAFPAGCYTLDFFFYCRMWAYFVLFEERNFVPVSYRLLPWIQGPPPRWRFERPISKVFRHHFGTQCAQFVMVNYFVEVRWLPLT